MPRRNEHRRTIPPAADPPDGGAAPTAATPALKVVCPLHGIRTQAEWQKRLSELLAGYGWHCRLERWSFGHFSLLKFFTPWTRETKLEWFRQQYDDELHDRRLEIEKGQTPSVVAHSFGTYILGYAPLLRSDYIRVNKVILCGSVLPTDFPWDLLIKRGQVQAVRNEYGGRDPWVKHVHWFVHGAGASGTSGFTRTHERLEQEKFDYSHSEYFVKGHMEDRWVPFLGKSLEEIPRSRVETPIPRPRTAAPWGLYGLATLSALIVAAVLLGSWQVLQMFGAGGSNSVDPVLIVHAVNVQTLRERQRVLQGRLLAYVNEVEHPYPAAHTWRKLSEIRNVRFNIRKSERYIVRFSLQIRREDVQQELYLGGVDTTAIIIPSTEHQFGRVYAYGLTSPSSSISADVQFEVLELNQA